VLASAAGTVSILIEIEVSRQEGSSLVEENERIADRVIRPPPPPPPPPPPLPLAVQQYLRSDQSQLQPNTAQRSTAQHGEPIEGQHSTAQQGELIEGQHSRACWRVEYVGSKQ
jgi:hypothetical protein